MTRYLRERTVFGPLIESAPSDRLGLVVVIPAKDEEDIPGSLESIRRCDLPEDCDVEGIVVVNTSEADPPERVALNRAQAAEAEKWVEVNSEPAMRFHILQCHGLKKKHAGVGLARKIGMDEACRRLEAVGNPGGVIACFDADSRCDANYLVELDRLFRENESCQACSVYFEHPLEGEDHDPAVYEAIILYELHLRYFIHAQTYAGFPHATQTIGSSMAVRCRSYQEQNGMNKRQAGEDFYFLHKYTPLGHVENLVTTRVIPSPRRSHRVPFGTGKAVGDQIDSGGEYRTYAPESFQELRRIFSGVDSLYESVPESLPSFLEDVDFKERLEEIRSNVTSAEAFRVRFFRWFNAFMIMKWVHRSRDLSYPDVEVTKAARWLLLDAYGLDVSGARDLLSAYRKLDRRLVTTGVIESDGQRQTKRKD